MTTGSASDAPPSGLSLNAEALYLALVDGVRSLRRSDTQLAGIASGGAWLAERLQLSLIHI